MTAGSRRTCHIRATPPTIRLARWQGASGWRRNRRRMALAGAGEAQLRQGQFRHCVRRNPPPYAGTRHKTQHVREARVWRRMAVRLAESILVDLIPTCPPATPRDFDRIATSQNKKIKTVLRRQGTTMCGLAPHCHPPAQPGPPPGQADGGWRGQRRKCALGAGLDLFGTP